MTRRLSVLLTVLMVGAVSASLALAAALHRQTATAGGVAATFTFRGSAPLVKDAHLTIVSGGQKVYDRNVTSPACGTQCGPGAVANGAPSIRFVPLETGGAPDLVLELYSGGANCCFVDQVFSPDPSTGTYVKTEHNFASAGALVKRLAPDHRFAFVSADDSFKYEFTDGADSGEPIQIWHFAPGSFIDVTRQHPGLIRDDASFWLRLFNHHLSNGVGLIAAWAADQELLGHDRLVQSTLRTEAARGQLRDGTSGIASGRRFISALNRFLSRQRYKR